MRPINNPSPHRGLLAIGILLVTSAWLASPEVEALEPVGTAFSYQGFLEENTQPADGLYDFQFNLYDGEDPLSSTLLETDTRLEVQVDHGLFEVEVDFGAAVFTGEALWLEVRARQAGSGGLISLLPLQPINAAPYALFSLNGVEGPAGPEGPTGPVGPEGPEGPTRFGSNGPDIFYSEGKVGLGTMAPTAQLDVAGTLRFHDGSEASGRVLTSSADGTASWQDLPPAPSGVPTGSLVVFAGQTAPDGWLLCDGSEISRSENAELFAILGITYGVGDGVSTFNLPDLRGRAVIGSGTGDGLSDRSLGESGGSETHQLTVDEMPSHTHKVGFVLGSEPGNNRLTGRTAGPVFADTSVSGGDQPHNNMQPFLTLSYIIKK